MGVNGVGMVRLEEFTAASGKTRGNLVQSMRDCKTWCEDLATESVPLASLNSQMNNECIIERP